VLRWKWSVWLGTLVVLTACGGGPSAEDFTAKVVGVHDGDTITVLQGRTQVRIRLHGIDCPESRQAFGTRAKQLTSELVFGQVVTIRPRTRDRYGRTVAEIVLPDGRDLSQELVRAGLAWWFRKYSPHDTTLARLEGEARTARRGLWSEANPLPPWEWRASQTPVSKDETGLVIGNSQSRVYHAPGCRNGASLSAQHRVMFASAATARAAGYRPGRDCHR
jgi:micrococcal nuclease